MPIYKTDKPTKDGRKFYFKISVSKDGHSRQIKSRLFATKKEAEKELAKAKLNAGKVSANGLTFGQAAKVFLGEKQSRLKSNTYDRNVTMLNHMLFTLEDIEIEKLTLEQYQNALKHLDAFQANGKPLSNVYKNKIIRTLKRLLAFTERRYDVTTNIPSKFEPYKNETHREMEFITYDEFKQFISVVDDPVFHALFTTLYFMGLRCGEANGLQWEDIDFSKKTLTVRKTVNTKKTTADGYEITTPKTTASIRTLPLPQIVSNELLYLYEHQYKPEGKEAQMYVFGGFTPFAESTLQNVKNRYFKAAGMDPIRIHDFRHSCASYLINKGASPLLVSKWLGHSNVTMTLNTYSHLWKSELIDIVNLVNKDTAILGTN